MLEKDFCRVLQTGLDSLGIEVPGEQLHGLYGYFSELQRWSKKINLIAKGAGEEEIIEKHFIDSLSLLLTMTGEAHLLDIGTGAGFPGLVCKVARPEMKVTLVEPRLKRVTFLNHIIRTLQLKDVTVVAGRVEDEQLLPSTQDFTHVVSRAVTDVGKFIQMVQRFQSSGAHVVCMKGPKWQQELAEVQEKYQYDIGQYKVMEITLPNSQSTRVLIDFPLCGIRKI